MIVSLLMLTYKTLQRQKRQKKLKQSIHNALLLAMLMLMSIGVFSLNIEPKHLDYALGGVSCNASEFNVGDVVYLGNGELVRCESTF